ncbi:hypothetical protein PMALA_059440 [Plasmodium malariae]|uniref:Uncharacterized protein n=1 Tax=Plasmodium malariae TaxID=5858 RepID=A0A1A8WXR9_PLAMA|nr:hypothetical protein PMALA_059440 [Plasmodium malariae]
MNLYFYSTIYDKSWNKEMKRNNILNVKFNRFLCGQTRSSAKDKHNESFYSDTYQEEMNYLMQHKKPQKYGAFNFKHNSKEKSPTLKRYDNIQNNRNLSISLKKFPSKN